MLPPTDHPQPVYICAPYAAPTWAERYANIGRVRLLAAALTRLGYAVVEVHTLLDGADDSDPERRAQGLRAACALVEMVARAGGRMVVVERDGGTLSPGCALELDAWRAVADVRGRVTRASWEQWGRWLGGGR